MVIHRWRFVGIFILLAILGGAAMVMWNFVGLLLVSFAMAYIIYPLAGYFSGGDRKAGRKYLTACLSSVLLVALPVIYILIYSLNVILQWLIENFGMIQSGSFTEGLKSGLDSAGFGVVSERLGSELGRLISSATDALWSQVTQPTWFLETSISLALFFVATFYFLYEGPRLMELIRKHIPSREKFLHELMSTIDKIFYGLFIGHLLTSVIIAGLAAIGFWAILRPSLLTLGFLVGMMFVVSFLPLIGPWLMYVPMGLWYMALLPGGTMQGILILIYGSLMLTIVPDFYIRPKLVRRDADIHPLLILLGFFGGPFVMGFKGIIIGPLVLGLAQAIVMLYIEKRHMLEDLFSRI
jgi:predicted PurR-regulated permease PerM